MESVELKNLWEQIKAELYTILPESVHPWLYPVEVSGYDKGVLTIVTGQQMGRNLLQRNHYQQIVDVIKKHTQNNNADVVILYDENATKELRKENEKIQKKIAQADLKEQAMENLSYMQSAANLNLKYKFENFVVGENNKFAYAVANQVAKEPATKHNPLFIYGASGLGKTHLMQAIGHYIIFNNPKLKVRYTKTEDYIDDFITNCRNSKGQVENMAKFNRKYTNIDVILIDDIQFIESKNKTMSQMQHTFDTLYNKGKQIVITSDRPPKEIATLSAALCSRFEMGLMVELTPPELQNRIDILKKLAKDKDLQFSEDALKYIAQNFKNNVRELEGAFNKVCAYADVMNEDLTLQVAQDVLKCKVEDDGISIEQIANVVSEFFSIDVADLKGTGKTQKIATARQIAIYLARELTGKSFVLIGEFFNKKHSTIMFANDKIKKEIKINKEIAETVREIKQALKVV